MAKALTVRTIDTLATPETRREVPDGLVNGLYLVCQPSGARSWAVRYRNTAGTPRKHTLGSYPGIDLKSAREVAQGVLVEVAKGGDPAAAKKAARTAPKEVSDRDLVENVVEQFIERYAKANQKAETAAENKRILEREVVKPWRGRHLAEITRADVHELLDGIVDRGSPVAANRILAALRRMCGWAVERGIITSSPCDQASEPPTAERSRDRVSERRRAPTACGSLRTLSAGPSGISCGCSCSPGQRRDEIGRMRWSEVDLARRAVDHSEGAGEERPGARRTAVGAGPGDPPGLCTRVARRRRDAVDYVFTVTGKTPVSGFSNAKERLDKLLGAENPSVGVP